MICVQKILFATDFSPFSTRAYFHAVALAEFHHAQLIIVHVYAPGLFVPSSEADEQEQRQRCAQLESIHPLNEAIPVRHVFLVGDPAEQILCCATKEAIDLIVVGTHSHGGLWPLMDSVAEAVLHAAHCSVLVVKMPRPQDSRT